jgi:hypothetical protein
METCWLRCAVCKKMRHWPDFMDESTTRPFMSCLICRIRNGRGSKGSLIYEPRISFVPRDFDSIHDFSKELRQLVHDHGDFHVFLSCISLQSDPTDSSVARHRVYESIVKSFADAFDYKFRYSYSYTLYLYDVHVR